jgi:D-alanine-D-alanine ligase
VRVAVLAGGRSSEHDVSLSSAASVRAGLEEGGHEPIDVRIDREGRWSSAGRPLSLSPGDGLLGAGVAFPVLHGPYGEDGTVQGLLDVLDLPYVGSGVLASSVAMDKVVSKDLLRAHGVPQVDYAAVRDGEGGPGEQDGPAARDGLDRGGLDSAALGRGDLDRLGLPVFVKPARLGSSVGISRAVTAAARDQALTTAFEHDRLVVVEALATGLELECSVLGNDDPIASQPGEIVVTAGDSGWYDYEAKYTPGGMELVVPARVPDAVRERVRELAVQTFRLLGCTGMARVDFFVDGDKVLVNELNTIPGFTATSVYAKLWDASGLPYPQLLDRLLDLAVERYERERGYRH